MINVRYYRTNTERKKEQVYAEFNTQVVPAEVKPVNVTLTGKRLEEDKKRYENEVADALLDAKFAALDEVREIVGNDGVLVAYEVEESEEE